jgi:hypothetical protein
VAAHDGTVYDRYASWPSTLGKAGEKHPFSIELSDGLESEALELAWGKPVQRPTYCGIAEHQSAVRAGEQALYGAASRKPIER